MPSVIKSNIQINVNGAQAAQQLNQVTTATQKVGRGFSKTQQIAQNLTFAVDDAVQTFGTGGLAGALRGAGNNLTLVAGLLGGIKFQFAAIAAVGIGSLLASHFDRARKAAEKLKDSIDEVVQRSAQFRQFIREDRVTAAQSALAVNRVENLTDLNAAEKLKSSTEERAESAAAERDAVRETVSKLQEAIKRNEAFRESLKEPVDGVVETIRDTVFGDPFAENKQKRQKLREVSEKTHSELTKELFEEERRLELLNEQVHTEDKLANAIHRRVDALKQVKLEEERSKLNKPLFTEGELRASSSRAIDITREIANLRNQLASRGRITAAEAFSLFPQANRFGSAGAVSTINAAQFGSQNIQDAGLQVDREQLSVQKRIEQLLKEKEIIGEIVGLN